MDKSSPVRLPPREIGWRGSYACFLREERAGAQEGRLRLSSLFCGSPHPAHPGRQGQSEPSWGSTPRCLPSTSDAGPSPSPCLSSGQSQQC